MPTNYRIGRSYKTVDGFTARVLTKKRLLGGDVRLLIKIELETHDIISEVTLDGKHRRHVICNRLSDGGSAYDLTPEEVK